MATPQKTTAPNDIDAMKIEQLKVFMSEKLGLTSFIMLFHPDPGMTVFHVEHVKLDDVVALLVSGLKNTITNIENNPQFSAEYKKLFTAFYGDLEKIIKEHNDRFKKLSDRELAKQKKK